VYQSCCVSQSKSELTRERLKLTVQLLRDVGLDFTFLLSTLLQPDPTASQPHPIFHNSLVQTPGPGYHIEPSPYPSRFDTPSIDPFDALPTSTPPLALKGRRRPSEGASMRSSASRDGTPRTGTPDQGRPPPPPRSARRVGSGVSSRLSEDDLR
jgi:hypothetical protein